jgi:LysR family transcriptional regulator, nitrogen assimilation regulatory protein
MDLKQIEYFVRVAELGSFTRASALLGIAQPALSRQVRLLEVELRQNLLVRNGRGATPTEAGKTLLEHGRGILHQVERAREDLGRVRGALAGRVAVGMPTSVAKVLTVPLIRAFQQRMPEASLSISEGLSVALHESLTVGRLDIALLYNPLPAPDMVLTELLQEDLVLVQHESLRSKSSKTSKAISLRELAAVPLIIPTRPNALRTLVETELSAAGQRATIALEIDGVAAMLDLVADNAGAAILPANAVRTAAHPEHYSMRPITGLRSRLSLATSAQRPATLTQQAVQTLIGELVKKYF